MALIGNCVVAASQGDLDRAKATQVLDGGELVDVTAG
jgi:aerobic C4-dicarboxylate transport protein